MAGPASVPLVSVFLDVFLDRLVSAEVVGLIRGKKLDNKLLKRLEDTLKVVRAVHDDVVKKQVPSSVSNWLYLIKHYVYMADDLLDEVSTKVATQKKVSNLFSRFSNRKLISKLEKIVVNLESLLSVKWSLNLEKIVVEKKTWRVPSTSLNDRSHIYGRDQDKKAIIKLLLEDSIDDEEVSVIPIVGMGGVGKTTLAQSVYHDEHLKDMFDFKAWVCVSQEFDDGKPTLAQSVYRLKHKKFLVVFDDVWIEDDVNWRLLKKPFQRGIRGSRIVVTTRSKKVASIVQTVPAYHLNELSNEDCWFVFAEHARLFTESSENTTTLEEIGREIVKKCNGLPLAAKSLGSMLRGEHDIWHWNFMLENEIWELCESKCYIIPALKLSYQYLPPPLKRCFVYCSLYPKNYEFQKDELIFLWMDEDLLKPEREDKTLRRDWS